VVTVLTGGALRPDLETNDGRVEHNARVGSAPRKVSNRSAGAGDCRPPFPLLAIDGAGVDSRRKMSRNPDDDPEPASLRPDPGRLVTGVSSSILLAGAERRAPVGSIWRGPLG